MKLITILFCLSLLVSVSVAVETLVPLNRLNWSQSLPLNANITLDGGRVINNPYDAINILDYGATDGGAVDTTAMQNAIWQADNSTHAVFIPPGTYNFSGIEVVSNITIYGSGMSTKILSGEIESVFYIRDKHNVTIKDMECMGTATGTFSQKFVWVEDSYDILVEDVKAYGMKGTPFRAWSNTAPNDCHDIIFRECQAWNCGEFGLIAYNCSDIIFDRCYVYRNGADYAMQFKQCNNSTMLDCVIDGPRDYGFYDSQELGVSIVPANNRIIGCRVRDQGAYGSNTANGAGILISSKGSLVSNCIVTNCTDKGIYIYGTATCSIISGNQIDTTTSHGLYVADGADYLSIIGNNIRDSTSAGAQLTEVKNGIIVGNVFYDNGGSTYANLKIDGVSENVTVTGNAFVNIGATHVGNIIISDSAKYITITGNAFSRASNRDIIPETASLRNVVGLTIANNGPVKLFGTGLDAYLGAEMHLGLVTRFLANAAPSSGTWVAGDLVWDVSPSSGEAMGWICTSGGTPGTWKDMAALS